MTVLSARTFIGRAIAPRAHCCGLLSSLRLAVWAASDRTWSSSGGVEDEHPLHIPRHGQKAPLATHFFESAHRKLTESEHGFDDAEHWFRGLMSVARGGGRDEGRSGKISTACGARTKG